MAICFSVECNSIKYRLCSIITFKWYGLVAWVFHFNKQFYFLYILQRSLADELICLIDCYASSPQKVLDGSFRKMNSRTDKINNILCLILNLGSWHISLDTWTICMLQINTKRGVGIKNSFCKTSEILVCYFGVVVCQLK